MIRNLVLFAFCFISTVTSSQSFTESSIDIGFGFGFATPLADLNDRFGTMAGGELTLNFYRGELGSQFGFKLGFMTSDVVKEDPLAAYRTSDGQILSTEGVSTVVTRRMAGSYFGIDFKKNLGFVGKQERAKFFIGLGTGLMQHKIRYIEFTKSVPLAFDDYGKGHDRNSRGLYLEEQIGVKFRNGAKKFDISINVFEGFLSPVGLIEFDTKNTQQEDRFDVGLGFKFTWHLSVTAKQVGKDIYY